MTYELQAGGIGLPQPGEVGCLDSLPDSEHAGHLRTLALRAVAVLAVAGAVVLPPKTGLSAAQAPRVAGIEALSGANNLVNDSDTTNYAGYRVTTPSSMAWIESDFIVPLVDCTDSTNDAVSIWTGVGVGTDADPLYQTGIEAQCVSGEPQYQGFWEVYSPDNNQSGTYTNTISAGDKIVTQILPFVGPGNNVDMYVSDYGSDLSNSSFNWSHEKTITLDTAPSPARVECVVEDPEDATTHLLRPLANFDTVTFSTDASGSFNGACDVFTSNNDYDHIISSSTGGLNHGLEDTSPWDIVDSTDTYKLAAITDPSSDGAITVTWEAKS